MKNPKCPVCKKACIEVHQYPDGSCAGFHKIEYTRVLGMVVPCIKESCFSKNSDKGFPKQAEAYSNRQVA